MDSFFGWVTNIRILSAAIIIVGWQATTLVSADGLKALTKDNRSHCPAWSPDGKWIAFLRTTKKSGKPVDDVWLMSPDGRNPRPLVAHAFHGDRTHSALLIWDLNWLPSCDHIFYDLHGAETESSWDELGAYVVNLKGNWSKIAYNKELLAGSDPSKPIQWRSGISLNPHLKLPRKDSQWIRRHFEQDDLSHSLMASLPVTADWLLLSPGGNQAIFAVKKGTGNNIEDRVFVYDRSTRVQRPIPIGKNAFWGDAYWSPDGRFVAYIVTHVQGHVQRNVVYNELWTTTNDGKRQRRLGGGAFGHSDHMGSERKEAGIQCNAGQNRTEETHLPICGRAFGGQLERQPGASTHSV